MNLQPSSAGSEADGSELVAARACPICAASRVQVLHAQKFILPNSHPLSAGYNVVCCAGCGFVYADSTVTQDDYDEFYARHSKYDEASIATGGGASPGDQARLKRMAEDIAPFVDSLEASILDVGCATGGLLREFQKLGFPNVLGLDPSPASARWAREHFNILILTGSLFEAPPIEPRDVVLCSHVLEHILDLSGAAQHLRTWTKPGGLLYVEVPDAARYADFLVAPFQDFNTEHINHFSLDALRDLFEPLGLSLVAHGAKDIEAAPGVPYPALWGLWRRIDEPSPDEPSPDEPSADAGALCASIKHYIRDSQVLLDAMDARLSDALRTGQPIIVWGTGQLLMKMLGEPALSRANIRCFVDGNSLNHGRILRGVPIVSPEELAHIVAEEGAAWPIVIGSTIHQAAIMRRIREELGWSNPIITLAD